LAFPCEQVRKREVAAADIVIPGALGEVALLRGAARIISSIVLQIVLPECHPKEKRITDAS